MSLHTVYAGDETSQAMPTKTKRTRLLTTAIHRRSYFEPQ
jgi:hypothetical protein